MFSVRPVLHCPGAPAQEPGSRSGKDCPWLVTQHGPALLLGFGRRAFPYWRDGAPRVSFLCAASSHLVLVNEAVCLLDRFLSFGVPGKGAR